MTKIFVLTRRSFLLGVNLPLKLPVSSQSWLSLMVLIVRGSIRNFPKPSIKYTCVIYLLSFMARNIRAATVVQKSESSTLWHSLRTTRIYTSTFSRDFREARGTFVNSSVFLRCLSSRLQSTDLYNSRKKNPDVMELWISRYDVLMFCRRFVRSVLDACCQFVMILIYKIPVFFGLWT